MELTVEQVKQLIPRNKYPTEWCNALNLLLPKYEINTPERIAAFVAQCAHESLDFTVLKENLHYRAVTLQKVFPKYFPTPEVAIEYANKPEKIANRVYANRMCNGDEDSGDGYQYCGRGLIQLTGKDNYTKFAADVEMKMEVAIPYLETFEGALESACWYWKEHNLNSIADKQDMVTLTRRINGGTNGLDDRIDRYDEALKILKE